MYSIFELFKVGVGPSSSHTVGPMIAANRFATACANQLDITAVSVSRVEIQLYGSLALTGIGHATDTAIISGLAGCLPDQTEPEQLRRVVEGTRTNRSLRLADRIAVAFDEATDIVWLRKETLPQHPNAMRFRALDETGKPLFEETYFSTGGGFVYSETEFSEQFVAPKSQLGSGVVDDQTPYPFTSGRELLAMCRHDGLSIEELINANERIKRTQEAIDRQLDRLWEVMFDCIEAGCRSSGLLPGPLKVPRRAPEIFRRLTRHLTDASSATPLRAPIIADIASDPLQQLDWVSLFALAVNEENAAGGRVVTAPTNGAAGIIPAVLAYYVNFVPGADRTGIHRFLKTSGAIGLLYKRNASLSAAEMGCQGEVGVACSMAAAGLAACMNGTIEQIENAAEIGMEHNLGLTCDPIGGLVQVPCIERNTMGATKAINAARLAVLYGDGKHFVSLDRVIETMRQTGVDMQAKYKETSLGGLAVNVVDC